MSAAPPSMIPWTIFNVDWGRNGGEFNYPWLSTQVLAEITLDMVRKLVVGVDVEGKKKTKEEEKIYGG